MVISLLPAAGGCDRTPPPAVTTTAPVAVTVGDLGEKGAAVFTAKCARCHGDTGQGFVGPPVVGEFADLKKYGDGQSLLTYMKANMPFDAPGSLTAEEYSYVISYILLENRFATAEAAFDELNRIRLE